MKQIIGRLRLAVPAGALVALAASNAAAQLPSASAAALGMGDNYTALARGFNSAAWNPAGLGMGNNPFVSFGLMSFRGLAGLDPVSLGDLKQHEGQNVSVAVRNQWLDEIVAEGNEQGSGGTDVTYLAANVGRVGVHLSSSGRAVANLGPGAAELILFGNAGRTGTAADLTFAGSSFDMAVTSTLALAYGQPLIRSDNRSLALGATLKYTFGHLVFTGEDNGGLVRASPLEVRFSFPTVASDTVLVFDKVDNGGGIGLDLGLAYSGGPWSAGVTAKNVFNTFEWDESSLFYRPGEAVFNVEDSEANFAPQPFSAAPQSLQDRVENMVGKPEVAAGIAFQPSRHVLLSADVHQRFAESTLNETKSQIGVGAELRPLRWLPVRVGGALLNDGGRMGSLGLGLEFGAANFTASVAQRDTNLGIDNIFMFTFSSMRMR
ncbi:MAG: hypothetical protein KY464_03925 [Gemmatimonadetes bacterium]|nr:hypothetical protein [Gemmatimonadota bacterium]